VVVFDLHLKWPDVMMCGTITTAKIIEFLSSLFSRFGLVEEVISDNGRQFVSAEFDQFLSNLGIKHRYTALYNPQANGAIERFNRVLKGGIKAGMADGCSFAEAIKQTLASYRSKPQATTGVSPVKVLYNFTMNMPLTRMLPVGSMPSVVPEISREAIEKHVHSSQAKMACNYNNRHRAKPCLFKSGDLVRIRFPVKGHKLSATFSEPRQVLNASKNTVWLSNGQRWNARRCILYTSEADPEADHGQAAEYPVFLSADHAPVTASDDPPLLRRSSRTRKPKNFGPDFV